MKSTKRYHFVPLHWQNQGVEVKHILIFTSVTTLENNVEASCEVKHSPVPSACAPGDSMNLHSTTVHNSKRLGKKFKYLSTRE